MSSKFRSSKSYPKPAHVCRAEIPGNPQPPSAPPSTYWATLYYQRTFPPDPSVIVTTMIMAQVAFDTWRCLGGYTPNGDTIELRVLFDPGVYHWYAELVLLAGASPYAQAEWLPLSPQPANPWYTPVSEASSLGGLSRAAVTLRA